MLIRVLAAASAAAFLLSGPALAHPGGLDSWSEYRDAKLPTIYEHPQEPDFLTAATVEGLATRARMIKHLRAKWREFDRKYWASYVEPEPVNHVHRTEPVGLVGSGGWWPTIMCESGGDPYAYNPAGPYMGLLQFDQQTWEAFGGAGTPMGKGYAETVAVANRVPYDAWPNC